jgi:hypothetical protein
MAFIVGCSSVSQPVHSPLPSVEPPSYDRQVYEDVPLATSPGDVSLTMSGNGELIAPVHQGQPAPFNGVVFNGPAVASIQVQYSAQQQRCMVDRRADMLTIGARAMADLDIMQSQYVAAQQRSIILLESRDREINTLRSQTHYNPWLMTGIGLLGGLSIFGLTYVLIH